jgi:hypothetical protein
MRLTRKYNPKCIVPLKHNLKVYEIELCKEHDTKNYDIYQAMLTWRNSFINSYYSEIKRQNSL